MKKVISLILCVFFLIGAVACSDKTPSYYGVWSIDSLVSDAPMGDFDPNENADVFNTSLSFSEKEASCFGDQLDSLGQVVSNPEYVSIDIPKEDFESMMGLSFDSLGISGSTIKQISVVNDPSYNNGIVFYVVNDDTLMSNSLGTFFILKKSE